MQLFNTVTKCHCHFILPFPFSFSREGRLYGWKALVVDRHHAKFGVHWNCGSGYISLVAEEQGCTCSPKSDTTISDVYDIHALTPEIAELRHLLCLFRL